MAEAKAVVNEAAASQVPGNRLARPEAQVHDLDLGPLVMR